MQQMSPLWDTSRSSSYLKIANVGHLKLLCHDFGTRVVFVCLFEADVNSAVSDLASCSAHTGSAASMWSLLMLILRNCRLADRLSAEKVGSQIGHFGGQWSPKQKPAVRVGSVNYVLRHTEVEVIAIFFLLLIYCVTEKNVCLESATFKFHLTREAQV